MVNHAAVKTDDSKEPGGRERRAYLILVGISIFLSVTVLLVGIRLINANNHKFCIIFTNVTAAKAPPKPNDPKAHPSRERAYEDYQRFLTLGRSLGCNVD